MDDRSVSRTLTSPDDALWRVGILATVVRDLTRSVERGSGAGIPDLAASLDLVDQVRRDILSLHQRALRGRLPKRATHRHLSLVRTDPPA